MRLAASCLTQLETCADRSQPIAVRESQNEMDENGLVGISNHGFKPADSSIGLELNVYHQLTDMQ